MKAEPLDYVVITTKNQKFTGLIIPHQENDEIIILKLDNGYNIGINKSSIKSIKSLKISKKEVKQPRSILKHDKNLKKVVLIHTGGTIASKVDYTTGGVTSKYSPENLVELVSELPKIVNIETDVAADLMSEDINFDDYKKMISTIKKHIKRCDGIILGHGTDTLAYTSAALAFAIENPPIPILIVGSQRSSDRPSSDSNMNLICAARFIAQTDFKGIAICMHDSINDDKCAILTATKTRKMHTSRRDAFKAINDKPIALVGNKVEWVKNPESDENRLKQNELVVKDKFADSVGLFKTHPNMNPKLFEFMTKNYDALVIEATGLGHMPTNTKENMMNYELLKKFIKKGGIIAITSQCLYGRVHPHVYTNLRRLSSIGCIFCEDMLSETAFIKLSWLMGNYSAEETKRLLTVNLRGEINDRSLYEE